MGEGRADRERALRDREVELKRQNGRLEEFANVVSHDLRNPLSIAGGNLTLARETGEDGYFESVQGAHDRMRRLIDDLLTLSRQGRAIGEPERVDVADTARLAWSNAETGDADLQVETDLVVDADRERLGQLFENVFRNSVEHGSSASRTASDDSVERSPTGSQASLDDSVERGGSRVNVRVGSLADRPGFLVADDGPGVPPDERERVFESGYSTALDGTGFGLAIVSTIVEAHGWSIRVGQSDEGGARFEIRTDPAEPTATR